MFSKPSKIKLENIIILLFLKLQLLFSQSIKKSLKLNSGLETKFPINVLIVSIATVVQVHVPLVSLCLIVAEAIGVDGQPVEALLKNGLVLHHKAAVHYTAALALGRSITS